MFTLSPKGRAMLEECNQGIRRVFEVVTKAVDTTVLTGHRSDADQAEKFAKGLSKTPPGKSKHNRKPSAAIDAAPFPIDWAEMPKADANGKISRAEAVKWAKTLARFYYFGGFVKGVAHMKGVPMRWGGDWDGDLDFTDQTFDDLVHFETLDP